MNIRKAATVEVAQNLSLIVRQNGKITDRRDGHNIWLDLGREYLANLIAYSSFAPPTTYTDHRIRYMGLGVGGTRQVAPSVANNEPILSAYPGGNTQTDTDPTVTRLERPVRITGSATLPPYDALDVWLGQVQAPATFPAATSVTFRRLFTELEISYTPYLSVPLSEIMLFTNAADPNRHDNTGVAYDTFDTLSKTSAFELEVSWTIRF